MVWWVCLLSRDYIGRSSDVNKDITPKAKATTPKAKAKDSTPKAKAKDSTLKAKIKDVTVEGKKFKNN